MTRHSDLTMFDHQKATREFTLYIVPETMGIAQMMVIATYVLFKVTTCLYLSPSNKARSPSILITVIVNKVNKNRAWPITYAKTMAY